MSRSTFTSSSSFGSAGPLPSPARPAAARITVPEATKIVDTHGKLHVVYTVQIRAPGLHRHVMKKFSEFRTFDIVWRSKYPSVAATLPPRVWLQSNKSDRVIAERQAGLEAYLNGLAEIGSIVPYLARFLGVPVDLLRGRPLSVPGTAATTGEYSDPLITHHRRRSMASSTIGSAISLTPSERDTAVPWEPPPPPPPRYREAEARSADAPSVKPIPAIRRTDAYLRARAPSPKTTADAVEFHGVLLMALEAVLAPGVSGRLGPGPDPRSNALFVEEGDLNGVLDRDWDTGLVSTTGDLVVLADQGPRRLTLLPPPPPPPDLRL